MPLGQRQHGNEKHALVFGKVIDGKYRSPGLAFGIVKQPTYIQRLTFHPEFKSGDSQQIVNSHGQGDAILGGCGRLRHIPCQGRKHQSFHESFL